MSIIGRTTRSVGTLIVLVFFTTAVMAQDSQLIAGQNINMVAGTEWPGGDPYLQRQNEPTIAVSTRHLLHLLGGSNDYRTIDLPFLPDGEGKTVGDSWVSTYFSIDGGGRWTSTLLPGYPQDGSALGMASPLRLSVDPVTGLQSGYEATADPVIRAGTNGLFFYSGIGFTRTDAPPSAGFVATYMDLNNDERGNSIGYVRTTLFDQNDDGTSFIDKPWTAVDKPRNDALERTLNVHPADGGTVVPQTVKCGNVYVAYARIQSEGSAAVSSQIMFTRSTDCAESFSDDPIQLSLPNTINQGAAVAIEPHTGRIQVAWRQFENATLNCTRKANFWRTTPEAWPVEQIELAGMILSKGSGNKVVIEGADTDDEFDSEPFDEFDFSDDADRPSGVLRQLLAAWLNALSGADSSAISDVLAAAEAWLVENPLGTHPKSDVKRFGNDLRKTLRDFNKGGTGPGRCENMMGNAANGMLSGLNPNAIMVVSSTDGGLSFSSPVAVTGPDYFPFEQGTTEYAFRNTGFATMTFDGEGRSYIAYSTRGLAIPDSDVVGGDGRIVVTTSMDGSTWTPPQAIDEPSVPGHQLMPAFEFSRGKLFLLYYDFREDISGRFERFITDRPVDLTTPRHSADVRAAQAIAADVPVFTDYSVLDSSTQTSRYPFLILDNAGVPFSQQMKYNPPNLPMFKGGTVPFFGDYIDLAASHFFFDETTGQWEFDIDPERGAPVVHAVWTDNRDVVGPPDGDWTSYVPPGDGTAHDSTFDPTLERPVCTPAFDFDRTKMRNQNIYTSRLTQGLAVAVPGNNRPLSIELQRVFVAFVQNLTNEDKLFRLKILNQPSGGSASFDQFTLVTEILDVVTGIPAVVVEANSSISRSVFVNSTDVSASVDISVVEVDEFGFPVPGGLAAITRINPDPSAPVPDDDNILFEEVYTPAIFNPAIFNSDPSNPAIFNLALLGTDEAGIFNPAIFNPAIFNSLNSFTDSESDDFIAAALIQLALSNPAIFNPAIFNLAILDPAIFNLAISNPAIFNPAIFNLAILDPAIFNISDGSPAIFNPAIFNPAIFNSTLVETTIVVENEGNATAAYSFNLDLDDPQDGSLDGLLFQVMIYRTYLVPLVEGCELSEAVVQEQLVNALEVDVNGSLFSTDSTSFFVAPGDDVVVTVRVTPDPNASMPGDPSTVDMLNTLNLSQSVVPQAVDTEGLANGETVAPPVTILAPSVPLLVIDAVGLVDGNVGAAYAATLGATGGGGSPLSWSLALGSSLPAGLSLTSGGQISGTPTTEGVFIFDVRAQDDEQIAEQGFSITVTAGTPLVPMTSQDDDSFGPDSITLDPVTGLRWLDVTNSTLFSYDQILVELGPGGEFAAFRLATSAEVLTFWQNAGINTGVGFLGVFTTQNFQPVVDLMAFVGVTGNNGNLGGEPTNFFDFTAGHIESGPGGGSVNVATLSSDPDPTVTGRPGIGFVPSDNPNNQHGAWLVKRAAFDSIILDTTTVTIDGPTVGYTATVSNFTGSDLSNVSLQGLIIDQFGVVKPAGGANVCSGFSGILPPGGCSFNFTVIANNSLGGEDSFSAGPATASFRLTVVDPVTGLPTSLDTLTVPITLE